MHACLDATLYHEGPLLFKTGGSLRSPTVEQPTLQSRSNMLSLQRCGKRSTLQSVASSVSPFPTQLLLPDVRT